MELVAQNGFIEHGTSNHRVPLLFLSTAAFRTHATGTTAQFSSNHYGTSVAAVKSVAEKGRICILDIEMEVCITFDLSPDQWNGIR